MEDVKLYSWAVVGAWHFPEDVDCSLWEFRPLGRGGIEVFQHRPTGEVVSHGHIPNLDLTDLVGHVVPHALDPDVITLRDRWVSAHTVAVEFRQEHVDAGTWDESAIRDHQAINHRVDALREGYRREAGFGDLKH